MDAASASPFLPDPRFPPPDPLRRRIQFLGGTRPPAMPARRPAVACIAHATGHVERRIDGHATTMSVAGQVARCVAKAPLVFQPRMRWRRRVKAPVHVPAQFQAPLQQPKPAQEPETRDDGIPIGRATGAARGDAQRTGKPLVRRNAPLIKADRSQRQRVGRLHVCRMRPPENDQFSQFVSLNTTITFSGSRPAARK